MLKKLALKRRTHQKAIFILHSSDGHFLFPLSRLCAEASLAHEVIRLNGLDRLVELCKDESARLGSDGVLVSCLATVRKIASFCGVKPFEELDASELVEPRLLDSFLIFSTKNESFV